MKIRFILREQSFLYFKKWKQILVDIFSKSVEYDYPEEELIKLGFKFLGKGAFRRTYSFPDNEDIVLKVCRHVDDLDMNKAEADPVMQSKYSLIIPKTFIRADDYRWIVMERVEPIQEFWEIDRVLPGFRLFLSYFSNYVEEDTVINSVRKAMQKIGMKRVSPTLNKFADFCVEYNVTVSELREKNLGITKDGRVVVLDASIMGPWLDAEHRI